MAPPLPDAPLSRTDLEARLRELDEGLAALRARVAALEAGRAEAPVRDTTQSRRLPPPVLEAEAPPSLAAFLAWTGRVFLILGGAFMLRALTDAGTLPRGLGVGLGLLYGAAWPILAWRSRRPAAGPFYATASVLICYPLIWEAATSLAVLRPPAAAGTLLAVAGLQMAAAWARDLKAMAWLALLAVLATAFGLMGATQSVTGFVLLFLALGLGTLWLTYGRRWHALRWPAALAADLAVGVMTLLATWPGGVPEGYRDLTPARTIALALALAVAYLGSFAARMLQRRRALTPFEGIQSALALLAGFGGALRIAQVSGAGSGLLGLGALMTGLGCAGAALPFARGQEDSRANFTFFSSLALVLLLMGGSLLLRPGAFSIASAVFGLAAALLGLRLRRTVLGLQSLAALACGAAASGLLAWSARTFLGEAAPPPAPPVSALVVLATLLTAVTARERALPDLSPLPRRVPPFLVALLAFLGSASLAIWATSRLVLGSRLDPGALAAIRTCVLSAAAVVLAALGGRRPASEYRWLVYPLLVLGAVRFLLEDLAAGRPLTLFLTFMAYGGALILSPRLLRGEPAPTKPPSEV